MVKFNGSRVRANILIESKNKSIMVNAQEWLDKNYPQERRKNIKELNITNKNLEGQLDLTDFVNLEKLDCLDNELTGLKMNYLNITEIRFNNNKIKDFDFNSLNPEKFNLLWMDNNQLHPRDLSQFSHLINLRELGLEGNPFYGSLEPLKNLDKLTSFNISNTDVDGGLEYLPDGVKMFGCLSKRPEAKVKIIEQELRKYGEPNYINEYYSNFADLLPIWKKAWREKAWARELLKEELLFQEKQIQELKEVNSLIFPHQPYNFTEFKQEIIRLKIQELAPQIRKEKTNLEQLVASAKKKVGTSLEKTIDLLLETQKQINQTSEVSQRDKLSNKIEAYQSVLEDNLIQEELQALLNKQKEVCELEKHLASLQQNTEQVAQIIQPVYGTPGSSQN